MGYRYLVLGAGMGAAIADYLLRQKDTDWVTVADKDLKVIVSLGRKLDEQQLSARCDYIALDIENHDLHALFKLYDVVVNALPTRFSPMLLEVAIGVKVGFCELGGVISVTESCLKLNRAAQDAGVSVVTDCGLQPGLGMIMARNLLRHHSDIKEIAIYVGGMPQKPRPPVNHQNMYSVEGLRHLCYDKVPILENGEIVYKEPRTEYELIQFNVLRKYSKIFDGSVEAFLTAGASIAPWTFGELGVRIFEKTLRWPNFKCFVDNIPEDKFEKIIMPHISIPVDKENPDFVFMRVVGKNQDGEMRGGYDLIDEFDPSTGLSAMQRTTGFTAAQMARWIAQKRILVGVNTPEFAIPNGDIGSFIYNLSHRLEIKKL